jgi:hypothetical protein
MHIAGQFCFLIVVGYISESNLTKKKNLILQIADHWIHKTIIQNEDEMIMKDQHLLMHSISNKTELTE